ncbi:MAG TPA: response regulator transcription factor [Actinomycetales bacterium]|nr:response regulator transcription factor [Actinomycetales bacterium]
MAAVAERMGVAAMPRAGRFTVLVVVGQQAPRESISRTMRALGARDVVQAGSVAEARARATALGPRELCVVDVNLPDGSGLGLLRDLRAAGWQRALALSSLEDPYTVRGALTAGVRCFLVSGRGSGRIQSPVANGVADQLSGREIEVLQHVANGRSNKEIGAQLGLSALTVKSHLARIARKLGTGDRAEMVMLALRAGVIS